MSFLGLFILCAVSLFFSVSTSSLETIHRETLRKDLDEIVDKRKTLERCPQNTAGKMDAENHPSHMPGM